MNKQDYSKTYEAIGISIITAAVLSVIMMFIRGLDVSLTIGLAAGVFILIGIIFIAVKDKENATPLRMTGISLCGMCLVLLLVNKGITNAVVHNTILVISWLLLMSSFVINAKIRRIEKKQQEK